MKKTQKGKKQTKSKMRSGKFKALSDDCALCKLMESGDGGDYDKLMSAFKEMKSRGAEVGGPAIEGSPSRVEKERIPACGLCGQTTKQREKTECCGNWVCGDESDYVLFSYSRDICSRNHRRFTLCGSHHAEEHKGDWKTCEECRDDFEPEMYVWYGTNEYNFEKLPNPPACKPTFCASCHKRIVLPDGGFTSFGNTYACEQCISRGFDVRAADSSKEKPRNKTAF